MSHALMLLVALGLDSLFGWPKPLFDAIGHPVVWIGKLIDRLDRWINLDGVGPGARRLAGLFAAAIVIAVAALTAACAIWLLPDGWAGILMAGVLAWPFIAMRSLRDHVEAVALPLSAGRIDLARAAVARIVGRDPNTLDRAGISRATLESLAENTSDGIVAPAFWGLLFGLPGIVGYKAINTLDSMIGHRTPRHEAFGWASARIDDLVNLIPARITGILYALVSGQPRVALSVMWRDASRHRSPNAGWPEAALAGALGVRLSGPRVYADRIADEPWINAGAEDPVANDVLRGLKLYRLVMLAMVLIVVICVVV